MDIGIGFPNDLRTQAAVLYDEAFRTKLRPAIRDDAGRIAIIADGLEPSKAIAAIDDGHLLGIAGFHDEGGSLTSGITFGSIRHHIGLLRATQAIALLALLDRKPEPGELLMDGIVVDAAARGRGIGTALFGALEELCRDRGYATIRLDVVDTNPGARRLYERLGFEAAKTERTPYLRRLMGFGSVTTMVKTVE